MVHVNPVASDGKVTIGYDADGWAGQWPGNMTETTNEWGIACSPTEFSDGNAVWTLQERADGVLVWADGEGTAYSPEPLLKAGGDR